MRLGSLFFRRVHKWVGLILGLQFLLWAISGAMMATLDRHSVAGGENAPEAGRSPLPITEAAWPTMQRNLGTVPVRGISVQPLLGRYVVNVDTVRGAHIFDAATGAPIRIDAGLAGEIARTAHPKRPAIESIALLPRVSLAVRDHALPIWRVDFADKANSSYYVSGVTGAILERRNDSWRVWDFFWMVHSMDYAKRSSFNHPLIVITALGAVWLALTGLYLILKTSWRPEARWLRCRSRSAPASL